MATPEQEHRTLPAWGDHLYTTSDYERTQSTFHGYRDEHIECGVFEAATQHTTPLYRLFSPLCGDHLYTTSLDEVEHSVAEHGYQREEFSCHVFPPPPAAQPPETIPLHRLFNPRSGDHLYTTSSDEAQRSVADNGYQYESIACYVCAPHAPGTIPLYRLFKTGYTAPPILSVDPARRRFILLLDDETVANIRAAENNPSLMAQVRSRIPWFRKERPPEIRLVSRTEAAALSFGEGLADDNVVYAMNPVSPTLYYALADFHRLTFEHKLAEAVRLLQSLGATSFRVERENGWSREMATSVEATLPAAVTGVAIGGSAGRTRRVNEAIMFTARLPGNKSRALPAVLGWYHREPTWQALADGRLHHGITAFSLTVRYEHDYGVNADFKLKVESAGFSVGGNFTEQQSTVWNLLGQFGRSG